MTLALAPGAGATSCVVMHADAAASANRSAPSAWEKEVLSARGFKRVGRHSEYAM